MTPILFGTGAVMPRVRVRVRVWEVMPRVPKFHHSSDLARNFMKFRNSTEISVQLPTLVNSKDEFHCSMVAQFK